MEKILDLSNVPKEVLLILEFLKEENDIATQKRLAKEVDWQLFINYTIHHRVYPLLYQKLRKFEELLVPGFVLDSLKQLYKKNTFKMLQLTREMNFINELLYQKGIQVIFLKGPILAKELYGDISLRTSGDLDFLIPIEQLENTERILLSQGYIRKDNFSHFMNDWKYRGHHVTFIHPIKKTTLEIHWKLHPRPTKQINFNELWKRKRSYNISSTPTYQLGKKDLLQYLIVHGSRHGWYRLRWLVDIQILLLHCHNYERELTFSKKNIYELQFSQAIILLNQLLETNLINKNLIFKKNSKILAQKSIFYLESMENLHSPEGSSGIKSFHKQYSDSQITVFQKSLLFVSMFYPSSADLITLRLPSYMHFLYFPFRPFLVVYRKLRKPIAGSIK